MRQEIRSAVADRAVERRDAAVRTDADSLSAASAGTDSTTGIASSESVVPASGSEPAALQSPAEQAPATAAHPVQTPTATSQTPEAPQTTVRNDSRPMPEAGPSRLVSGRNYVVMGVFSSERNARRAAAEASAKEPAVTCGIYRFGSKFMVSPFESDDAEACRLYIRAHEERFPGMWTYTAR